MTATRLTYEVEYHPLEKAPRGKKQNPVDSYIHDFALKIQRASYDVIHATKFGKDKTALWAQNKVRSVLNKLQEEVKKEEKELYYECKAIKDLNQRLIGVKIVRII